MVDILLASLKRGGVAKSDTRVFSLLRQTGLRLAYLRQRVADEQNVMWEDLTALMPRPPRRGLLMRQETPEQVR